MSSGEINKKRIYKTDKSITKLGLENSSAKFVPENSVLIALAGQGKTRGKVAINNIELTINQSLAGLIPTSGSYYEFIFYNLEKRYSELRRLSSGAGSRGGLNKKLIQNIKVQIPNLREQTLISKLSETLDKVFTLYERKLKLLSKIKKYFLDNLFAEKDYPNLRFKGFTDAWEQRKLGKQNKITMGQSPSSKNYTDNPKDWILIQGNADLKSGKVAPRIYTSQLTKKADIGDIILTVRAPVGEVAITNYNVVLGRGVAAIKGNLFIYFALEKFKANNKWNMYSSGSTFDSIIGKDLNNLPLFFPSETEENKIGELLNKLDNLLTLYENKQQHLTEIKKTFLKTMFI